MRCAFYEKEITPPLGGDLPGYFGHRFAEDVEDRLYAKAAVFAGDSDDPSQMTAILVLDSEKIPAGMRDAVIPRASEMTGIPQERIVIAATHTHYGIPFGSACTDRDDEYMEVFYRLAADTVTLAFKRLRPCTLTYGIGYEDTQAFNRDFVMQNGCVTTNPRSSIHPEIVRPYGEIDPDLPVLTAWDENGNRMGVIFTYALHQDTVGKAAFSGDFSSEVSHQLKARYGSDFVSVFLAGYCGDINHVDPIGKTKRDHRSIGKVLAAEIARVTESGSAPVADTGVDAAYRILPLSRRKATAAQIEKATYILEDPDNRKNPYMSMGARGCRMLLEYAADFREEDSVVDVPLQVLRIGDVWLFASPFEMYHQFAAPMKAAADSGKWLITELANMGGGYIPVPELLDSDTYPAQLNKNNNMEPDAGHKIGKALADMAAQMRDHG